MTHNELESVWNATRPYISQICRRWNNSRGRYECKQKWARGMHMMNEPNAWMAIAKFSAIFFLFFLLYLGFFNSSHREQRNGLKNNCSCWKRLTIPQRRSSLFNMMIFFFLILDDAFVFPSSFCEKKNQGRPYRTSKDVVVILASRTWPTPSQIFRYCCT